MQNFLEPSEHGYFTRGGQKYCQPLVNTETHGINSFSYQGAKIWNSIPIEIKSSQSLNEFKCKLNLWPGPQCSCGSCTLCHISRL